MVNFKARLSARLMFIARWRYEWGEVASSRYFCGTVIVLRYGVEMLAFASMTGGGFQYGGWGSIECHGQRDACARQYCEKRPPQNSIGL